MVELRDRLELERAVETGTYHGGTARVLAGLFASVVTVELSDRYFEIARSNLADLPNVAIEHGSSAVALKGLTPQPTLYWLDAHWSGLDTAGVAHPCPVLDELAVLPVHPSDCLLVDDARLFAASRGAESWPELVEVIDAIRASRPGTHVTVLYDLIICVPAEAKDIVDEFGIRHAWSAWEAGEGPRLEGTRSDTDSAGSGEGGRRLVRLRQRLGRSSA